MSRTLEPSDNLTTCWSPISRSPDASRYEKLATDPVSTLDDVYAFLGLEYEDSILAYGKQLPALPVGAPWSKRSAGASLN